ncbi:MAG: hypothetical protein U9O59_01095 [Actinomycetota bacterium]|nr:hypothetical protein [Actinomycetota bacterium]
MKKRDILIIIILTIILAIASISTLERKPEIENIYLSTDKDSDFDRLKLNKNNTFSSSTSGIYLIMKVKHLKIDNEIKVEWGKTEDNSIRMVLQESIFNPAKDGSGKIVVLLVKKNNTYASGDYYVEINLNGNEKISEKFYINPD